MTFDASTFSTWPPALVFALIVVVLITKVLPDTLGVCTGPKTCPRSSTDGTSSRPSSPTTTSSVASQK